MVCRWLAATWMVGGAGDATGKGKTTCDMAGAMGASGKSDRGLFSWPRSRAHTSTVHLSIVAFATSQPIQHPPPSQMERFSKASG